MALRGRTASFLTAYPHVFPDVPSPGLFACQGGCARETSCCEPLSADAARLPPLDPQIHLEESQQPPRRRLVKRREVDANLDVVVLQRSRAEERKHHLNVDTLILQIITSLTFLPTKNWSVMKQEISAFHQSGNKEGKKDSCFII
ncbi:hypothetical protein AMECASPLE_014666 [Ameca splendens]|uniref:Uncharacterized protein n=1 Tax=Ameca splendens TaxID=208324 RepID=A0ABV0YDK7_9TELE